MMLLPLVVRSVLRNRRRSVITISSIAIGPVAMIFNWGFTASTNREMVENTTRYFADDAQAHLRGYYDDSIPDPVIPDSAPVLYAARNEAGVAAASIRLETKAPTSRGDKSRGLMPVGAEPADKAQVTMFLDAIVVGQSLTIDVPGVLTREMLAEALVVRPGQDIMFAGQGYDSLISNGKYPMRGILRSKIDDLDGYAAVMPLPVVREFLFAPGGATVIVLRLCERSHLEPVSVGLAERLGDRYEVVGWPRLLPMVAVSSRFHEVMTYVAPLVFFVVAVLAVANPVLMSAMERTREFGIMLAVGMSRTHVLRLVLHESIPLGIAGPIVGNAIDWTMTVYFARTGIHLHGFEAGLRTMPRLSDVAYPVVNAECGVMLSVAVSVIAGLAALYSAAKTAQL